MSKKAKGKKGKGKKKKGGGLGDPTPEELSWILQTEKESLQKKLIDEQHRANTEKAAENEVKSKVMKIEKDFEEEVERTADIISDMTRQYKSKEEDLLNKICNFEERVTKLKETTEERKITIDTLKKEKEDKLDEKNKLIKELKDNIDSMSSQFAEMLKETLNKMKTRIENANKQWEEENETNIIQRFDEHMKMK
ncbi:unnamed protein product [Moneuplotes crassus]|uniref:Dynein regulatory complex protein 12 n=1 Tax=Euplotes crassus TaxID=5936 RepID=A0AAD2D3Z8_EUPCR|nr:unnamed protein product [Moneuplotes crassus]